jgi:hypothetical protein
VLGAWLDPHARRARWNQDSIEQPVQGCRELTRSGTTGCRSGADNHHRARGSSLQARRDQMAEPTPQSVTGDRIAHGSPHDKSGAGRSVAGIKRHMHDKARRAHSTTLLHRRGEILAPMYSPLGRQHRRG